MPAIIALIFGSRADGAAAIIPAIPHTCDSLLFNEP
jgi:hypothetical protein